MAFRVAKAKSQSIPRTVQRAIVPGGTWKRGALLVINASNQWAECGADPASIAAVSLSDVGAATGIGDHFAKSEFPPGYTQGTGVQDETVFRAPYVGSLPAVDGALYGVVKDSDTEWKVDFSDTTATRVKLVGRLTDSPENQPEVLVTFLAANVQVI